jgi:hypothetical protein
MNHQPRRLPPPTKNKEEKIMKTWNDFTNTDFEFEAANFIDYGITNRDKIKANVESCLKDNLKEFGIFTTPKDFEKVVEEYTDNIMKYIIKL